MMNLLEITKTFIPKPIKRMFPMRVKEAVKGPIKGLVHTYQRVNAKSRALPYFIIVGAQKAGTTSLYSYLTQHPNILPSLGKEVNYFNWNYKKGINWYRANFPLLEPDVRRLKGKEPPFYTGEASPYYMFYPYAMERILRTLPSVRIIMMLRNPVDRAYSSYQHQRWKRREKYSFEEAIDREPPRLEPEITKIMRDENYFSYNHAHFAYLARGVYVDQVKRCLELFPKDQVLIIESERFFANSSAIYAEVLEFLGLSKSKLTAYENVNPKNYKKMCPETRERLVEYYLPHNRRLYEFLDRKFDWDK